MAVISRSSHQSIRYLTSSSLEALYAKLRTVLGETVLTFFAKPERRSTETIWYSEYVGTPESYLSLSDDEKDTVGDYIEDKKAAIMAALSTVPELKSLSDRLFVVPSTEQIHVYRDANNNLVVVLSQWACSKLENTNAPDPISFLVNRRSPNRSRVVVRIHYSNGTEASNQTFTFEYGETVRQFKTDSAGLRDLGNFKNNSNFQIYELGEGMPLYLHKFTVMPDQEFYKVVFPLYSRVVITVLDQDGSLRPDTQIQIDCDGNQASYSTDSAGKIEMSGLEVGKVLKVAEAAHPDNQLTHTLLREDNLLTLRIHTTAYFPASISVRDETGQAQGLYPLIITIAGQEKTGLTDEQGLFKLSEQQVDAEIEVRDGQNAENIVTHNITEGDNEIVLIVKSVPTQDVTIRLINHKNNPLPATVLSVSTQAGVQEATTNIEGRIGLPQHQFSDKEKVNVMVQLQKKDKVKKIRKDFTYKKEQAEYTIKLRRLNWWWLLLLLLPLLFLKCEKNIVIKTTYQNSNTSIPGCSVGFGYNKAFLYDQGRFFTRDEILLTQTTDSSGQAYFQKLKFSVYSYFIWHFSRSVAFAENNCFTADTLSPIFHHLFNEETINLKLTPISVAYDFRVVDESDLEPLPGAMVRVVSECSGILFQDSVQSDANGGVVFRNLPKCGRVILLSASLDGYYPDSLPAGTVEQLAGPVEGTRTLKLKPIREKIVFFVKNCRNGQPVPDAKARLTLEFPDGLKKTQAINTNVNGVGKGQYDEAHVIAEISIEASKQYFKNGTLPQKYKVIDFIRLPDSLRTICLEPDENTMEFQDVDAATQIPLAGVKNYVSIKSGNSTRIDSLISNSKGYFTIGGIVSGDVVSILAIFPPNYVDNDYTIKQRDAIKLLESSPEDRKIPLKPREVELSFRTIDANDNALVDNAELKVIVDGKELGAPRNSGKGEFKVKAPYSSVISIVADKDGYVRNDTKVYNKAVSYLITSDQSERDIPLTPVPKVNVTIKIINHNSQPDEIFDLIVNGKNLGTIIHNRASMDVKEFKVALSSVEDNEIELDLSNGDGDTGSQIVIEPGNLHIEYSGNDISYYFIYNARKNQFFRVVR